MDFSIELIGHNRLYELENITREVFSGVTLDFTNQFENKIISKLEDQTVYTKMICDHKEYEGSYSFSTTQKAINKIGYIINLSFLDCVKKMMDVSLPWGILVGIRPSKKVEELQKQGFSQEEIKVFLKESLLITEDKIDLMIKVAEYEEQIKNRLSKDGISIYIGIPFCPTRCAYCSFISKTYQDDKLIDYYLQALEQELKSLKALQNKSVDTIYIGGGTPTTLTAKQLDKLLKNINENININSLKEYTIEAGRPDTITEEKLRIIKNYPVDRISINPQTLNDKTLKLIGRNHTAKQFFEAYDLAAQLGFKVMNTDLIAGLPEENLEDFSFTLNQILSLSPQNITIHTLSIKRASQMSKGEMTKSVANEMLIEAKKQLKNYFPYYLYRQKNTLDNLENVGYTIKDCECIYNSCMMGEIQSVISLGGGGVTKIIQDGKVIRIRNPKDADYYIKTIDDVITKKEVTLSEYFNS